MSGELAEWVPVLELVIRKVWWARQDLNLGPTVYESAALTAELRAPALISF